MWFMKYFTNIKKYITNVNTLTHIYNIFFKKLSLNIMFLVKKNTDNL